MLKSILIIEDEDINRELLRKMLRNKYSIFEACNGEEGLQMLAQHGTEISAILLDIVMPVMDGYEFLKQLFHDNVWSHIPVIVCTDLSDTESQLKALSLGACCFTIKPYNSSFLLSSLTNVLHLQEKSNLLCEMRHDSLTGLLRREAFLTEATTMIAAKEPSYYILSCLDIDNFKLVNDQYSTETGDQVLCYVADCIRECTEAFGGICCRFMADNYAMLYPASFLHSDVLASMHEKASQPPFIDHSIRIRTGRYLVNDTQIPVSTMYDRATLAQESIKGRYDCTITEYNDSLREQLIKEHHIVSVMYDALHNHEFVPWFQPQCNYSTGSVVGAEALVRWEKPDGSLVFPNEFIPVFERNGFIYEIDKYIWEQSCIVLRHWIDEGRAPLPISVNISRHDIFHDDFFPFLTELVVKYDLPIDLLRLEVTESAFSEAPEQIITAVKKLVTYGFTVEIDDFGSGYSSLNTLKDVPANVLKLDMLFLSDKSDSERSGIIIESVIRMAKWLGMSVIAEGVEVKEQADYLKSIGCYIIQGYYYAKPMPLNEYEALLDHSMTERETHFLETIETYNGGTFWNAKSLDTLIFNSYVGGASIYEFHDNTAETIRANDRFRQEFGDRYLGGIPVSDLSPDKVLDAENLKILYDNTRHAIETHDESTCEVKTVALEGGNEQPLFLRCTSRILAKTEDRYLCYSVMVNITSLRMAEEEQRKANEMLRMLNTQIKNESRAMTAIMDGIPGGFGRFQVLENGKISALYFSDGFLSLIDIDRPTLTRIQEHIEDSDILIGVHPHDQQILNNAITAMMNGEEIYNTKFRLKKGTGEYIWLMISGKMHRSETSETFLNVFYSDATETIYEEGRIRSLLDNLPCGAALYEYDGKNLTVVHLNKQYWNLLETSPVDYSSILALSYVHPEDHAALMAEITSSISQERDISCDIRIRNGAGKYHTFHICAHVVKKEDGTYSFYTTFTSLSGHS